MPKWSQMVQFLFAWPDRFKRNPLQCSTLPAKRRSFMKIWYCSSGPAVGLSACWSTVSRIFSLKGSVKTVFIGTSLMTFDDLWGKALRDSMIITCSKKVRDVNLSSLRLRHRLLLTMRLKKFIGKISSFRFLYIIQMGKWVIQASLIGIAWILSMSLSKLWDPRPALP